LFRFDLQRFNKGTTVTTVPASVPDQTAAEAQLEQSSANYASATMPNAMALQNMGMQGIVNNGINPAPNYSGLYQQGVLGMNQAQQLATNAQNGVVNQNLQDNQLANINYGLQSTMGNAVNNLGSRGVLNSSVTGNALHDISNQVGNQISQNYQSNMANESQLANQQMQLAQDPMQYASNSQKSALQAPMQYFSMATGQAAPTQNMWQTQSNQRYSMATPEQTIVSPAQQSPIPGLLGTLGSAMIACFVAGTKISTPDGDANIEDLQEGDEVNTLLGVQEIAKTYSAQAEVVKIVTDRGEVTCTESEYFLTLEGSQSVISFTLDTVIMHKDGGAKILGISRIGVENVYEIVVPWFYANGFVVDGFDPEVF